MEARMKNPAMVLGTMEPFQPGGLFRRAPWGWPGPVLQVRPATDAAGWLWAI